MTNKPEQEALPPLDEKYQHDKPWEIVAGYDENTQQLRCRERQLAAALSSLAKAEERNRELEKERDTARMACSLACELHGCASELCTYAEYHKDAQKMFSDLEAAESELSRLREENRRMIEAINWVCGCGSNPFDPFERPEMVSARGRYWWRGNLIEKAGLSWNKPSSTYQLPSSPPTPPQPKETL